MYFSMKPNSLEISSFPNTILVFLKIEAFKDKIVQPFFTTKDTGKGTGLGLSLAYDIVKAHAMGLSFESIKNQGTTFKIILPI